MPICIRMETAKFLRTITKDRKLLELLLAEYSFTGNQSPKEILKKAKDAIQSVTGNLNFMILVNQSAMNGLEQFNLATSEPPEPRKISLAKIFDGTKS